MLVGITGWKDEHWKSKLAEINRYKIKKIGLFLEMFTPEKRKKVYRALLDSEVKEIPLVHLRNEMSLEEIRFLMKNFKTKYFTIHESTFRVIKKWDKVRRMLYLEMNADNKIPKGDKVQGIGGFCVDLSHYMMEKTLDSKEYGYIETKKTILKYFKCNHVNGYSYANNRDVHTVKNLKEFEYLKKIPKYLFGDVIAIETFNSIKDQLIYKKHLVKLLEEEFGLVYA